MKKIRLISIIMLILAIAAGCALQATPAAVPTPVVQTVVVTVEVTPAPTQVPAATTVPECTPDEAAKALNISEVQNFQDLVKFASIEKHNNIDYDVTVSNCIITLTVKSGYFSMINRFGFNLQGTRADVQAIPGSTAKGYVNDIPFREDGKAWFVTKVTFAPADNSASATPTP